MDMSSYKKSRKQRRQGIRGSKNSRTTLRPKLGDFKRKREEMNQQNSQPMYKI